MDRKVESKKVGKKSKLTRAERMKKRLLLNLHTKFRLLRIWLADKLLPKGKSVRDDVNDSYVTQKQVDKMAIDWLEHTKELLYVDMTKKYQHHKFADIHGIWYAYEAKSTVRLARILPSWVEIYERVEAAFDAHRRKFIACETWSDFDFIKSSLKSESDMLYGEIRERVVIFEELLDKAEKSEKFAATIKQMLLSVSELKQFSVEYDEMLVSCLERILITYISHWETFCNNRKVSDLEEFFKRIEENERKIALLWNLSLPKKGNGNCIDLESLLIGIKMALKRQ